ncbi:ABC transporter substrate binding protein [uncultured Desulfobacter sp.]|uniref:ABC transporter substrate binding protein n=1 Tax=uncultured Desulfobacter sp. TaxID=240139 RepID=UPI0029F4BE9F|nr:ABC transporter substrate binding protein [uncultured Desulfobacter sp.]
MKIYIRRIKIIIGHYMKIIGIVLAACFLLSSLSAQERQIKNIVVIVTMPVPVCDLNLKWFLAEFDRLGYKDGETMNLTVIRANGDRKFAENELRRIIKTRKPDAVATIATLASQAAMTVLKDTNIPIFFSSVSDPVGAGLIKKVGEPTGINIAGRVFTVPKEVRLDVAIRLARQIVSEDRPIRLGYIFSSYPSSEGEYMRLKTIARENADIQLESYRLDYKKVPEGIASMLADVKSGIKALSGAIPFSGTGKFLSIWLNNVLELPQKKLDSCPKNGYINPHEQDTNHSRT